MGQPGMQRWRTIALVATALIAVTIPLNGWIESRRRQQGGAAATDGPRFVGREKCIDCHRAAYDSWLGSDHDLAMDLATDETVLGDFDDAEFTSGGVTSRFFRGAGKYFVRTEGPGGAMDEFELAYTFGFEPLQQYLAVFPDGRLQALSVAWDTKEQRWFHLYPDHAIPPDDWLHWTRNAQNWNGMCAECHSTNLRKNYDAETRSYRTSWSEIDVSCEACHGPGSTHVDWAEVPPMARPELPDFGLVVPTGDLDARRQVELCAPCHSRRSELGDYDHTGTELLDHMLPALIREGLYFADGQIREEVYVYGSFLQSKMYQRGIKCSDCHDVHSLQLREKGNDLCLQCHQAETYDTRAHHFHKKIHQGEPSDGALCVKCHMREQPFMVVDWRADHSFRVPRPDLTAEIGVPNACTQAGCHDDRPLQWSLDAYRDWYGRATKPQFGTLFLGGTNGDPVALPGLIRLAEDPLYPAMVRASALMLVGNYPRDDEVTRAVHAALQSEEPLIRHTALQALSIADPRERVDLVAPLLFDPVKAVRTAAASVLAGTPDELLRPYQRTALAEGIREYRAAMEPNLDFSHAGLNLGNLEASLGRPDRAADYYRKALEVDDRFVPAAMNLAILLSQQGRPAEAEAPLRRILELVPEHHEGAYSLGLLLVELNRPTEAVDWLRRAAEGMPRNARVRYNLGLLLQALGQPAEAERALRSAVELEPRNPDFLFALGDHYLKRGMGREARAVAERLIAEYPDQPVGHQLRAAAERLDIR